MKGKGVISWVLKWDEVIAKCTQEKVPIINVRDNEKIDEREKQNKKDKKKQRSATSYSVLWLVQFSFLKNNWWS